MTQFHFIGIGGIGMSGLARILLKRGCKVSGSDAGMTARVEELGYLGATVTQGHAAENVPSDAVVVYSTAIKEDNPEYQAALHQGCLLQHRSELLNDLLQGKKVLAVTGTHGKTTTSSLLATVLVEAGLDPSFAVGGIIPQFGVNGDGGEGELFAIEADESDGSFVRYNPFGAIVTNIDTDHMDHYGTEEALQSSFEQFISQVSSSNHLFWCGDDPWLSQFVKRGVSYGFGKSCLLWLKEAHQEGVRQRLDIHFQGREHKGVELNMMGQHNALNALSVFGLAMSLGVDEDSIRKSFATFQGVCRRAEKKGEVDGIVVIDDYAHHPTEIKALLEAMKQSRSSGRLIALYQPHRYSRTQHCMDRFEGVFNAADKVFVTDIYAAGEAPIAGVSGQVLAQKAAAHYVPKENLVKTVAQEVRSGDLVLTIGAGDITHLGEDLVSYLEEERA